MTILCISQTKISYKALFGRLYYDTTCRPLGWQGQKGTEASRKVQTSRSATRRDTSTECKTQCGLATCDGKALSRLNSLTRVDGVLKRKIAETARGSLDHTRQTLLPFEVFPVIRFRQYERFCIAP